MYPCPSLLVWDKQHRITFESIEILGTMVSTLSSLMIMPAKVFQACSNFLKSLRMSSIYCPLFWVSSLSMMSLIERSLASSIVNYAKYRLWMKWAQLRSGFISFMLCTDSLYSNKIWKKSDPIMFWSFRCNSNCLKLILLLILSKFLMSSFSSSASDLISMRSCSIGNKGSMLCLKKLL